MDLGAEPLTGERSNAEGANEIAAMVAGADAVVAADFDAIVVVAIVVVSIVVVSFVVVSIVVFIVFIAVAAGFWLPSTKRLSRSKANTIRRSPSETRIAVCTSAMLRWPSMC